MPIAAKLIRYAPGTDKTEGINVGVIAVDYATDAALIRAITAEDWERLATIFQTSTVLAQEWVDRTMRYLSKGWSLASATTSILSRETPNHITLDHLVAWGIGPLQVVGVVDGERTVDESATLDQFINDVFERRVRIARGLVPQ